MKIFIDTSVFIRHYYGSNKAVRILDYALNEEEAITSPNVIEETFFKLLYMETERIFGKTGKYALKDKFRKEK
ncbi:PIN domain-containing protein [Archaeoglobus fulgidus]|uniref:PIN domain protein n=1 Tax=Archaeoglobus fulgidus DSM 8774 TaxID=1344584 RepID=A0A075WD70_ARCFL|nr:PIN domain-containing protein [Archaeoglobus fulgidus]AIG97961.1 PIN domain protein [Archaeoglobus fulgidus DSM 8774]